MKVQKEVNAKQQFLKDNYQTGPFVNRSATFKIHNVGPVLQQLTDQSNGFSVILKLVISQKENFADSILTPEPVKSGPIRTANSSRRFKSTVVPAQNTSISIKEVISLAAEHDALFNLKRKINLRADIRKQTRDSTSALASVIIVPEPIDTSDPYYTNLCPPITKLGELPSINLTNCFLNTHPLINSFGCYNVPTDTSQKVMVSAIILLTMLLTWISTLLEGPNPNGDTTDAQLSGGSDSSTQVNSSNAPPQNSSYDASQTASSFSVNNVNMLCWNVIGLGKKSAMKN